MASKLIYFCYKCQVPSEQDRKPEMNRNQQHRRERNEVLQCIKSRGRDDGSSCLKNKLLVFPSLHSFQHSSYSPFRSLHLENIVAFWHWAFKNAAVQYRVTELYHNRGMVLLPRMKKSLSSSREKTEFKSKLTPSYHSNQLETSISRDYL